MNQMKEIRIDKVTLNFGAGKDHNLLNKGIKLLEIVSGVPPVQTTTDKRIPGWGLRPGLPIGCKVTLRGKKAEELLSRLIKAKDNIIPKSSFDNSGNISFGIHEYIDIPDAKYDPDIGIIGLQVSVTLKRPGFRIKNRSVKKSKIGKPHMITQDDAMNFLNEKFDVKQGE
ncbi:50S ribosomal protein L5 [Candidatus Woesearchaeota archaeon]|nr:MAG: 50S ribosomal protein L5 [Candidatus Woesearchaeota archaeon]